MLEPRVLRISFLMKWWMDFPPVPYKMCPYMYYIDRGETVGRFSPLEVIDCPRITIGQLV